jgi:hypothetical protein
MKTKINEMKNKKIELLEGDFIIQNIFYDNKKSETITFIWDAKNERCVELEEYLKKIQSINRKIKLEKLKIKY